MRFRMFLGLALCLGLAATASAQYGSGGGMTTTGGGGVYKAPRGGYSSSTGIAIGAGAAAGIGLAYYVLYSHKMVVGCVESSADGNKLMNEKDKNTYALVAGNNVVLAPGERVALKGKKVKDGSGNLSFRAEKLVKDYGSCK